MSAENTTESAGCPHLVERQCVYVGNNSENNNSSRTTCAIVSGQVVSTFLSKYGQYIANYIPFKKCIRIDFI